MIKFSHTSDRQCPVMLACKPLLASSLILSLLLLITSKLLLVSAQTSWNAPLVPEEVEAHFEIEHLLGEMSAETNEQNNEQFLQNAAQTMRIILESQHGAKFGPETSRKGEIRGFSTNLMQNLVDLQQLAAVCSLDELSTSSERVGSRSVLIERQLETQLVHLNKYLAALFVAAQNDCEWQSYGNAGGAGGSGGGSGSGGSSEQCEGLFKKTLNWFGL